MATKVGYIFEKPFNLPKIVGYNLEQGTVDRFSKVCFSTDCCTSDFFRAFRESVKILVLGSRLGTCYQIEAFKGFC